MWYEILPTFIIITSALTVPPIYAYYSNKLGLGQPYRRVLTDCQTGFLFLRDGRVGKNKGGYSYSGLEGIPDGK